MKQQYKEGQGQVINVVGDAKIYIVVAPVPQVSWWRQWLSRFFKRS